MDFLAKIYQRPLDLADGLLDGITSYRLVLYYLLAVLGWAVLISFDKKIPYTWHAILLSALLLAAVCRISGEIFSRVLNVARNFESDYITALILTLIMIPALDMKSYAALAGAGFAAVASKYLITIGRQHLLNPAATGAVVSGLLFHHYAGWWVGTTALMPLVLLGGLLVARKMKRFTMIGIFLLVYLVFLIFQKGDLSVLNIWWLGLSETAVLFFGFIMLTEPLTSPDSFYKYTPYAALVAVLYSTGWLHISPEEALLIGNVLAYSLVRGKRLQLTLTKTTEVAEGIYSFAFNYHGAMDFKAGQYLEWTLPLRHSDSRGNRRYLTLSSSPTEHQLSFTVRVPAKASHFKQQLMKFKPDETMLASHLGGSFTLPSDPELQLAFIAGGIGVTPFRSMVKYLVDKKQQRHIKLIYAANKDSEFAFKELFAQAKSVGVETHYLETAAKPLDKESLAEAIPDYKDRIFYLSGPQGFVQSVRSTLLDMGVSLSDIKSDYFPGYN